MVRLTHRYSLDRRTTASRNAERLMEFIHRNYQAIICAELLLFVAFAILWSTFQKARNSSPQAPQSTEWNQTTPYLKSVGVGISRVLVKPVEAEDTPYCFDPITCIRDVGEELGYSNGVITTMIRIGRCESGLKPDSIGKNTNGTFDMGIFQINDVHSKRISRADRLDFVKNVKFAYKLYGEHGNFGSWRSSQKCWNQ